MSGSVTVEYIDPETQRRRTLVLREGESLVLNTALKVEGLSGWDLHLKSASIDVKIVSIKRGDKK